MKIKPLLYITDESSFFRQLQVVGWGSKSYSFVWEPNFHWSRLGVRSVGAYVRRYESLEAFDAEQSNLVGRQRKWPVFFSVEVELDGDAAKTEARIQELIATNQVLKERLRFLETALQAQEKEQPGPEASESPQVTFIPPEFLEAGSPGSPEAPANFPAAPVASTALDVPPPPAAEQPPRRRRG